MREISSNYHPANTFNIFLEVLKIMWRYYLESNCDASLMAVDGINGILGWDVIYLERLFGDTCSHTFIIIHYWILILMGSFITLWIVKIPMLVSVVWKPPDLKPPLGIQHKRGLRSAPLRDLGSLSGSGAHSMVRIPVCIGGGRGERSWCWQVFIKGEAKALLESIPVE